MKRPRPAWRPLQVVFAVLLLLFPAISGIDGPYAQPAGGDVSAAQAGNAAAVDEQAQLVTQLQARAQAVEAELAAGALDDLTLVERRVELEQASRRLDEITAIFRTRLEAVDARLAEIGEPAADGATEPANLRAERQALAEERATTNAALGEAEALSQEISNLLRRIAQLRRDIFAQELSARYDILRAFGPDVVADQARELRRIETILTSWGQVLRDRAGMVLLASVMALAIAAFLTLALRRAAAALLEEAGATAPPSFISRLSLAFWSTLLPSVALAAFLASAWYFFDYFGLLGDDIGQLIASLFRVTVAVFFVSRLWLAIFSPDRPEWRLMPFENRAARRLNRLVIAMAVITGTETFLTGVSASLQSPLSVTVARSLIAALLMGLLIFSVAATRPYADEHGRPRRWSRGFRILLVAVGSIMILSGLAGYVGFARFFSQQVVVTGAILVTMYIGLLSARAISEVGALRQTMLGRHLERRYSLAEAREDQLGLIAGIVINLMVLAIGLPLLLLQWGFRWGDLESWALQFATEIRIGSLTISLVGILTGILVFVVGFLAARGFQRWLDGKVMTRGRVDPGIRNSISTAVGYAGIAIAALFGLSVAGINLSNLALVAGALSLGIGFGLQNIVNNFVSGLILLAERPFKVGDWIVAGQVSGIVSKISVRATEIETFQRQTVILPNSDLINAAVGNWTHRNRLGRVDIPVRVAHGTDPRKVHDLLLEIAKDQPRILRTPEPFVVFLGYGDTSLDFELRYFIGDVLAGLGTQNEVRFQILERLAAAGISMPRPQSPLPPPAAPFSPMSEQA